MGLQQQTPYSCRMQKLRQTAFYNVEFYLLKRPHPLTNKTLQVLHKKKGDFEFLEGNHSYIQWLFPNHHKSNFNYNSYPLTEEEAEIFRKDILIGKRLLISYDMYCDFVGLKMTDIKTGSLQIISKKRLDLALNVNRHNQLRITRIIACLSMVGFRMHAESLIKFLDQATSSQMKQARPAFQLKWKPYLDQQHTVKICKIPSMEVMLKSHPVLSDQQSLQQLTKLLTKPK